MPSQEVLDAVGEAPARSAADLLKVKRAALAKAQSRYVEAKANRDERAMSEQTRLVSSLTVLITELEQEATAEVEAAGRQDAEKRLLGIKKAFGSQFSEYREDKGRVNQAVAVLWEAITKLNARGQQLEHLRNEAAALADRFGLDTPQLAMVTEPEGDTEIDVSLPRFWRVKAVKPGFETCEHNVRERRTYTEIVGTPGYEIITRTGLKPFRELNEYERDVLEEKEKVRNAPADPTVAAEAEIVSKIPPGVSYHDASTYRG